MYRMMQCFAVTVQRIHFCDYDISLNIAAAEEFEES